MRGMSGVTACADFLADLFGNLLIGDGVTWTTALTAGGQRWSATLTSAPEQPMTGRSDPGGLRM